MTHLIENDTDSEKPGLSPLRCLCLLPAGRQEKGSPGTGFWLLWTLGAATFTGDVSAMFGSWMVTS